MFTFVDPLERAERTAGDRTAFVCGDRSQTFGEFASRCRKVAGALDRLGLDPLDRVALWAPNSDHYAEIYMGVPASGRAVMPLNTRHAVPELQYQLDDAGARILISDFDAEALAPNVERVIGLDEWNSMVDEAPEAELGRGSTSDTMAGLFYTGGTTGASKGVVLTHGNLIANAWHILVATSIQPDDRYLIMAPMFHAAGSVSLLPAIWVGATQVILPAFSPAAALDLIEESRATMTLAVPTMVSAMNELQRAEPRDTSTLRILYYGASPIATEVVRTATRTFPEAEMCHLYGATELAPLTTTLRHHERHLDGDLARSAGQPVAGVDVRVFDDDWNELPPGEVGRVVAKGPNVMKEYWGKPEATAAVLRDGWYDSGDLGYMDEHSNLFLVDRAKDMIISGGENVYCTEVEEALFKHPMVLEATVFGIPHDTWGEAVHAVIVPRGEVTAESIIEHCRQLIAGYKVPRSISFQSEPLPKSGPGKILKRELRAPYWEGHDKMVH